MRLYITATLILIAITGCTDIETVTVTAPQPITEPGEYRLWIDASLDDGTRISRSLVVVFKILGEEVGPEAPADYSGFDKGFEEATIFLSTFESRFGYPFGGDGSILLFFKTFSIPLKWSRWQGQKAGQPVTDSEMNSESPATITLATEFDYSRFTPYHYGAVEAAKNS